jgi:hypothetical protein
MLVLDDVQSRESVDKARRARDGSAPERVRQRRASAFPVSIARIATWAEYAETRGFALVPISTLACAAPASSRTAARRNWFHAPRTTRSPRPAASHAPRTTGRFAPKWLPVRRKTRQIRI